MSDVNVVHCDGAVCSASIGPQDSRDGWMALAIAEHAADTAFSRRADLCPVHVQDFLQLCGPLPRASR